ncbi:MAG TPA: NAD-dependent epimerase/dehydratase family protein [Candidatus Deferrimicrobiaceae bacterium]
MIPGNLIEAFKGRSTLITGGLGFIGSTLAIGLVEAGARVTVIDSLIPEYGGNLFNVEPVKDDIRINISDVRDEHAMKYLVRGQEFLFNLAGQTSHLDSMRDPFPDLDINTRAQLSILEACRKHNPAIKIVFASTRQMYGVPQYLPVDERHPLQPVDVNGVNKMAGERYHLLYNDVYGIRSAVLRLTNTYGPRMRIRDARQTFLGIWIRRLLDGHPIRVFGDGSQRRDFNYVDDVVLALMLAASSEDANGAVFNLGGDEPVSLERAAGLMISLFGGGRHEHVPFPPDRKAIDIGDFYADYGKIRSTLGWRPETGFEAGLRATLDYYREHIDRYRERDDA